jgi:hypothetical protein
VARRGQSVYGRISVAQKSKAGGGESRLGVELTELVLVDGQQIPVQTQFTEASGGGVDNVRNLTTVGVMTGMGAAIGAAADGGRGAGIGAVAGAAAGMLGVALTPGKPTVFPPETLLNFRLMNPVSFSTVRSQAAFQPVSQQDYSAPQDYSTPPQNYDRYQTNRYPAPPPYSGPSHVVVPPPPPAAPYYGYTYYYGYPYYGYSYPYYGPYYYSRPYYSYGPSFVFSFHSDRGRFYGGRHH